MVAVTDAGLDTSIVPVDGCAATVYRACWRPGDPDLLPRLAARASEERRARAARFRFEADAIRCLASEALLRHALAGWAGLEPGTWTVAQGPNGKPFLSSHRDVHFNLSHSGNWLLCAVARSPVGVDVEEPRTLTHDPSARFMSLGELDAHRALPASSRTDHFYRLWTLKESALKAAGTGFSFDPRQISISLAGDRMIATGTPPPAPSGSWQVHTVPMPAGVFAAVCVWVGR
jgi:4'-phosphopantetheinyl transferase